MPISGWRGGGGACDVYVDTLSLDETEGDLSDNNFAYMLQDHEAGEITARGKYTLSQSRTLGDKSTFHVDGYVAGGTVLGASGTNVNTLSCGETEGDMSDNYIAYT